MTGDLALETLRKHLSAAHMLSRDTRSVLEHLEHPLRRQTEYAIDFSEIFSLAFPNETADEMRVFEDEDPNSERLVQLDALHYMFFENPNRPILLPEYGIELRSLISRIRAGMLNDLVVHAQRARYQLEETLKLPDVDALLKLIDSDIDDEGVQKAWELFEKHAGSLLLLTQEIFSEPLRRIMRLFELRRLADVPTSRDRVQPDETVRDRWFEKLVSIRGRDKSGASYIDASAMATAYTLNHVVGREQFRVVIVSRSNAMHAVFENEFQDGFWTDAGGYVLRHPRTFGSLYRRFEDEAALKADLNQRRLSLQLFINAAATRCRSNEPLAPEESHPFIEQMSHIRHAWQQTETLSSANLIESAIVDTEHATNKRERLTIALKMLRQGSTFDEILSNRVSELLVGFERKHESLGFALQTDGAARNDQFGGEVRSSTYSGKVVLASSRYLLPYTLQFYSQELAKWACDVQTDASLQWSDIVEFLQIGLRSDADYERLLAMAYLLASLDRWSMAEQFCERALAQPTMNVPRHEGFYFLAICKRMHQESPERYHQALDHLDIAQNTKRAFRADAAYRDPRYLAERGTQIYMWNRDAERHTTEGWKAHRPPRVLEARIAWEQALTHVRADTSLAVQLNNNLCFYYCDREFNEAKVRQHLNRLMALNQGNGDMSEWNPLILDTIAFARLMLHKIRPNVEGLRIIARHLRSAIGRNDVHLMPKTRTALEETLHRLERELAQRAATA